MDSEVRMTVVCQISRTVQNHTDRYTIQSTIQSNVVLNSYIFDRQDVLLIYCMWKSQIKALKMFTS